MMERRYKLTDQNMQTHNGCQWEIGAWKETNGDGELYGPGWLHCYAHPLLAMLHNPIHAEIATPRLWVVEVTGRQKTDGQMKEGWSRMRLVEEMPLPTVLAVQRVAYGILCALEVCSIVKFRTWATAWLSGEDRSGGAAEQAALEAVWLRPGPAERALEAAQLWRAQAPEASSFQASRVAVSAGAASKMKTLDLVAIAQKAMNVN